MVNKDLGLQLANWALGNCGFWGFSIVFFWFCSTLKKHDVHMFPEKVMMFWNMIFLTLNLVILWSKDAVTALLWGIFPETNMEPEDSPHWKGKSSPKAVCLGSHSLQFSSGVLGCESLFLHQNGRDLVYSVPGGLIRGPGVFVTEKWIPMRFFVKQWVNSPLIVIPFALPTLQSTNLTKLQKCFGKKTGR